MCVEMVYSATEQISPVFICPTGHKYDIVGQLRILFLFYKNKLY